VFDHLNATRRLFAGDIRERDLPGGRTRRLGTSTILTPDVGGEDTHYRNRDESAGPAALQELQEIIRDPCIDAEPPTRTGGRYGRARKMSDSSRRPFFVARQQLQKTQGEYVPVAETGSGGRERRYSTGEHGIELYGVSEGALLKCRATIDQANRGTTKPHAA